MQLVLLTISLILFLLYAALLLYYRRAWKSLPSFSASRHINAGIQDKASGPFLSVIIPARNEEKNLPALLQSLRQQTYPVQLFEILVIDDHSTDNTPGVVLSAKDQNVQLISLIDQLSGNVINSFKKKAIENGVANSRGELIVTTDADCILPPRWLETIAAFYTEKKPVFMAMPVAINCHYQFIEIFQALDFMTLQGITGAAVHKRIHSMCNGANLAYTKKAFEEVGGFKGIDHIASGDDMLLMHKIAQRYPQQVMYAKSNDLVVQTAPVSGIRAFFQQRIRWASKAGQYQDKTLFPVLLIVYLFNCMLIMLPLSAIFKPVHWYVFNWRLSLPEATLLILLLKTVAELFFLYPVARFFQKQPLLWYFPLMQPFHILYTVIAGWLGKFGSYQWKERTVK